MPCRECGEKVIIKASGVDICCCPYCCNTLMEHEASETVLLKGMDEVQQAIMKYRNANNVDKKEEYRLLLKNKIHWLNADSEFYTRPV